MNVTLSVDEELLKRAREHAARRGTSLNQLIRDFLSQLTSGASANETVRELRELWASSESTSGGRKWTRDELYDRSVLR